MTTEPSPSARDAGRFTAPAPGLLDVLTTLRKNLGLLLGGSFVAALLALGATYLVAPVFTSRTVFLPPQPQQSSAAAALSSLNALVGAAGLNSARNSAEQYVSLMQTRAVVDRIIESFGLTEVYEKKFLSQTRKELLANTRISIGKKDGLVVLEVDDTDAKRAAAMANRYVEELGKLTEKLALSEAQQRRVFFGNQLAKTKDRLSAAQASLEASGFNQNVLRAEPRAAADGYARLRAEATAAEIKLQALRRSLLDNTTEVQSQQAVVFALRAELAKAEATSTSKQASSSYIDKYREYKYQETLFDLFARQFELARLDESREGALIQVVDAAEPADMKSWPRRGVTAALTGALVFLGLSLLVISRKRPGLAALGG